MSGPCGGIDGCWHTGLVNVGYYPYEVYRDRTPIRVGPSEDAAVVETLSRRARFGVQSTRNPENLDLPSIRGARNGFVWGYSFSKGISGWVGLTQLIPDDPPSDAPWATGPAGADFQVGASRSVRHGKNSSCAGEPSKRLRTIDVTDTYLRYAPHSTPYWYVVKGDVVRERWRGRANYVCVEVVESAVCPRGTRGWVPYDALRGEAP